MQTHNIPLYVTHEGTIKISGRTASSDAARCALHFLERGVTEIDFFYIGANAGQQAMKAMGIFRYLIEKESQNEYTAVFQPSRVATDVLDDLGVVTRKDAVYWRPFVLNIRDFNALMKLYAKPQDTDRRI